MVKIKIALFVDVDVNESDGHSWEALQEGMTLIKDALKTNPKIGDVISEGISWVYKD